MMLHDIQPLIDATTERPIQVRLRLLNQLLAELRKRNLHEEHITAVNNVLYPLLQKGAPAMLSVGKIRRIQSAILRMVESEIGLVPKNYYRNIWGAAGMAVFGIPFGVLFALSLHNMAFFGIGIPLGMAIGLAVGKAKDQIALREGSQLEMEIS